MNLVRNFQSSNRCVGEKTAQDVPPASTLPGGTPAPLQRDDDAPCGEGTAGLRGHDAQTAGGWVKG